MEYVLGVAEGWRAHAERHLALLPGKEASRLLRQFADTLAERKACRKRVRKELRLIGMPAKRPRVLRDRVDIRRAWIAERCANCAGCPMWARLTAWHSGEDV